MVKVGQRWTSLLSHLVTVWLLWIGHGGYLLLVSRVAEARSFADPPDSGDAARTACEGDLELAQRMAELHPNDAG
jgi:hypothetical protein